MRGIYFFCFEINYLRTFSKRRGLSLEKLSVFIYLTFDSVEGGKRLRRKEFVLGLCQSPSDQESLRNGKYDI